MFCLHSFKRSNGGFFCVPRCCGWWVFGSGHGSRARVTYPAANWLLAGSGRGVTLGTGESKGGGLSGFRAGVGKTSVFDLRLRFDGLRDTKVSDGWGTREQRLVHRSGLEGATRDGVRFDFVRNNRGRFLTEMWDAGKQTSCAHRVRPGGLHGVTVARCSGWGTLDGVVPEWGRSIVARRSPVVRGVKVPKRAVRGSGGRGGTARGRAGLRSDSFVRACLSVYGRLAVWEVPGERSPGGVGSSSYCRGHCGIVVTNTGCRSAGCVTFGIRWDQTTSVLCVPNWWASFIRCWASLWGGAGKNVVVEIMRGWFLTAD